MKHKRKIRILPEGPYEVSAEVPLNQAIITENKSGHVDSWEAGKTYEKQTDDYHLCRCGHSGRTPYCDGTHKKVGFEGSEVADRGSYAENAEVYEGAVVDLLDKESLCAVARFCDSHPTTWDSAVDSDKPNYRDIAIEKACNCPSGRLTVAEKDGTLIEPQLEQEISLIEDAPQDCKGPLWVKGGIPIESADGTAYEVRNRVTLCRCGNSQNAPFCDASHLRAPHMKGLDR